MKWILAVALIAGAVSVTQRPLSVLGTVTSPDGRTVIEVRHGGARELGPLVYHVARDGEDVIADSPLGVRRRDQDFGAAALTFVGADEVHTIDERYTLAHGKARERHVRANERTLHFKNAAGAPLAVILRAQNDGVAFRYRFPDRDTIVRTVVGEETGFRVPSESTAWMLPRQAAGTYAPAYEDLYREVKAGTPSDRPEGWDLPALFRTHAGKWALVTESALDASYCGSHLAQSVTDDTYRIALPGPAEGNGVGNVEPESTMPWTMPWRVVIVGDRAADIVESTFVTDVAPASTIGAASWVKPGRAAWSWWSMSDSPKHAEQLNAFTDLAAEMGWEYALVDANWNLMQSGTIVDVIAHAKARNVGLLFWYNSGGPHNVVTEAPRDRMFTHEQRVKEFTQLQAWGVKGVKVDFWQSDKQDRIRQYRELLQDAADFHLMVDFHGSTIPRGWQREFPNLIGMEAVAGAEQYKFREDYAAKAPWLNTVLPFTRNAIGPMDFTPVTFGDAKYPHVTTNAHELALSVIFEDGIQHFADSVESYRRLPDPVKTFLKQVPAAWDETRVLAGEPGKFLVMARRDRDAWYVAGVNGQDVPQQFSALQSFGQGHWHGTQIGDGSGDREFTMRSVDVTASLPLAAEMRAHGGFVVRLERRE